jgi:alkylation response protein AidB-like acyl-CoA dehydrogenase
MKLDFAPEEIAFRETARAFVAAHFPPDRPYTDGPQDRARWAHALNAKGWAAYKWPKEFGGTGWSVTEKFIWERETAVRGVPAQLGGMGMGMLAPVLQAYGTAAQQARHLPGIKSDAVAWCQGYSEPGAGSDLASLATRAARDGDHYIVDGEKCWTSWAHIADWMFALVRTSREAKRQAGITFLLIDMRTPGIAVSPIHTLDGRHHLNRVTFTNVCVPMENRVGEEGFGWTIAKGLLTHERTGLAYVSETLRLMALLANVTRDLADANFHGKRRALEIELGALEITELRTLAEAASGQAPGPHSSTLKLKGTGLIQAATELFVEAAGLYALPWFPEVARIAGEAALQIGPAWAQEEVVRYYAGRAASIAGGTDEVQRDIIAKHVLGLQS